ncbi:MAG: hypothetical protein RIR18_286 [Pseudomonadota bacterium]|jgi:hypothetical protein
MEGLAELLLGVTAAAFSPIALLLGFNKYHMHHKGESNNPKVST